MTTAWLMLLVPLSIPVSAWHLADDSPVQRTSTATTLTGDELLRIGALHDAQNHLPESLTYYQLALSVFRERRQASGVAAAQLNIGQVYERQGKFREAFEALQEAVPVLSRSTDKSAEARALLAMGRVSARLGRIDRARASLEKAVFLFNRVKDRRGWNEAAIRLGFLHLGDGLTEVGLSLLQQARQDARAHQDRGRELAAMVAYGDANWFLDRAAEARQLYSDSLRLAEAERDLATEAALRLRLAHLEGDAGFLQEGIASGKRLLWLSQMLRNPAIEAAAWSLLAELYERTQQTAEAEESEQRALMMYRTRKILVHGGG